MMNDAAASVRPARLVLWFAGVAIAQAALLLTFAGLPVDGRDGSLFAIYVGGSSALGVWAMSVAPELAANARTRRGRAVIHSAAAVAMAGALGVSAYFAADRFGYHPFSLIFAACVIVLASVPFFATLVLTLIGEWYAGLPKRPG